MEGKESIMKKKIQLTSSTRRSTRRKFFPANFFKSSVDQRGSSISLANKLGYFETSSSPRGVLQKKKMDNRNKPTIFYSESLLKIQEAHTK